MESSFTIRMTLVFLDLLFSLSVFSQAPFSRGINLTGWFQADTPGQIQFAKFTKQDIIDIKSLGCDVIRLPVNMNSMTLGPPSYRFDPLYVSFLDSVVDWCEDLDIYLIIDNHSFDPNVDTSPGIGDILIKVWSQMAQHLKERSEYILYEILNEPHGITTAAWGSIQNQVITAIRAIDAKHTIVVGGSGYNSYNELKNLPVYSDKNLLYTFHFYDPFVFTHQGASWTSPSMEPLSGVPFPYNAATMPVCPPTLKGTWIESNLQSYPTDGTTDHVRQLIDIALNFRTTRNVNIFCGEFGVYIPNSNNSDRSGWYSFVRQYLETNNVPWTIWDYKGGFGLFNKNSNEMFDHDLNISMLQSLGFNIPPQTPFSITPDTEGFLIYSDFVGHLITDASYGVGKINFYSDEMPNNGIYSLYWNGYSQYNAVVFNFVPDRDLTELYSGGYSIDFMVRGNKAGIKFDIRFVDTKTEATDDHPWRMSTTIDDSDAEWNLKWHHINIPLTNFTETGSWDNGLWFNPEGRFDWSAVDRIEIATEHPVSPGQYLWFDNIHITDLDTALVRETGIVGIEDIKEDSLPVLTVRPNPVRNNATISIILPYEDRVSVSIFTMTGIRIRDLGNIPCCQGERILTWDGCDGNGNAVGRGMYICVLNTRRFSCSCKIIKY
jgi:endoglucanase